MGCTGGAHDRLLMPGSTSGVNFPWHRVRMNSPIETMATAILAFYLLAAAVQWGVCLFGTSDDGLHCVGAIFSIVLAPLAVGLFLGLRWWARRRRQA